MLCAFCLLTTEGEEKKVIPLELFNDSMKH